MRFPRHLRRSASTLTAAVLGAALLASCSPPASDPNTGGGGESSTSADGGGEGGEKSLTVWLQDKPSHMSPMMGGSYANGSVFDITQERLVRILADGELEPRAAESWEISEDAKTITVKLTDATWSDGEPMTADDVVWTANVLPNPEVGAIIGADLAAIDGYQDVMDGNATEMPGVKKVDDRTVEFTLSEPNSSALYQILNMFVLPQHALEDIELTELATGPQWSEPGEVPGLGPFVMTANVTGQRVEFEKNEHAINVPKFDKLVESLVSQDVATQQLASGEIDLTLVAPTDIETVEGMDGVETLSVESSGYDRWAFNQRTKDVFKDKRVRAGFITALDREGVLASVYNGAAEPWNSSFTSPKVDYSGFETYDYDPEQAKQLLTEGGWDFDTPVEIAQLATNEQRVQINQVLLKNLQDIGVKASIKTVDSAAVGDMWQQGTYDLYLYGGGNYLADPSIASMTVRCDDAPNNGKYCNPELDELFDAAAATADEAEREQLLQQAAELENSEASHLWLGRPTRVFAHGPKITGGVKGGEGMSDVFANSIHLWEVAEG